MAKTEATQTEEVLNLLQKLAKIRQISEVAKKSKKGFNYTYTDITEILANVTAGMKKYGVSLIPMIVPGTGSVEKLETDNTKFTKTGDMYNNHVTEILFKADMIFRWVDDESGEKIEVPWFAAASMSDASQSLGSAMTYTMRQFLTTYFQIGQTDYDVDEYRSKQKEAEATEDRAISEGIIAEFDKMLKAYLADNRDKEEDVKKFIKKYVKNANYFQIKEPSLAAKLFEDFKKTFEVKEDKEEN